MTGAGGANGAVITFVDVGLGERGERGGDDWAEPVEPTGIGRTGRGEFRRAGVTTGLEDTDVRDVERPPCFGFIFPPWADVDREMGGPRASVAATLAAADSKLDDDEAALAGEGVVTLGGFDVALVDLLFG